MATVAEASAHDPSPSDRPSATPEEQTAAERGHGSSDEASASMAQEPQSRNFFSAGITAQKLLQILEAVREMPSGQAVFREAKRVLLDLEQSSARAEHVYAELLDRLLQDYARRSEYDPEQVREWELLRRQLQPPLLTTGADALRARLDSLLGGASSHAPQAQAVCSDLRHAAASLDGPAGDGSAGRGQEAIRPPAAAFAADRSSSAISGESATPMDRCRRDESLDQLQQSLGRELRETLTQNEEFGVVLDLVLAELQRVHSLADAQHVRERLLQQVKRLHSGHFALAQKLDSADRYLSMLTLDSRQLHEEIHRVQQLSLTDELTSLSNRRAFMARLEEEVARVERYGMPLTLVLIDLDGFKRINDLHGHAAGDEVLRCYATQIFSVFRNHDLVARYGGEEFAVVLPNTDHRGAAAALRKARECAARVRCRAQDTAFPVPSFSAGVATFQRGESSQRLIDRADEALYRAKRNGRDRVEFAGTAAS